MSSRRSGCAGDPGRQVKLVLDLSYGAANFVMPNLLSKVGADVLSINPYAQTPGMISVDRAVSEARVADAVRGSGADLGAVIDAGGERLTLIDGTGHVLSDDEAIMAFLELSTMAGETGRVALPVTASDRTVRRCRERGVELMLTPLVAVGVAPGRRVGRRVLCLRPAGRVRLPGVPARPSTPRPPWPAWCRCSRTSPTSLAEIVDATPPMPILQGEVPTPMEQKGLIMRTLMEQLTDEGAELVLVDGIKVVSDEGWALVVPDPADPVTHVWAEGVGPGGVRGLGGDVRGADRRGCCPEFRACSGTDGPVWSPPMNIPEDLRYSPEHEWVRLDGTTVRVGITDYAQDALGDIVFVDLPAVGTEVEAGGQLGEVESTKSVSEIYAPLAGTVTAVNDALTAGPETINQDPYGEGWLCELELAPKRTRAVSSTRSPTAT